MHIKHRARFIVSPLSNYKMASSDEYSYIRGKGEVNVPFLTIPDMIRRHAEQNPTAMAQIYINWETFEKENLTFASIYSSGTKFAKGLKALGISKGDIVAIGTNNCPEWITVHIGAQMCGAISLFFTFSMKDGSDIKSLFARVGNDCKAVIFPPGKNDDNIPITKKLFTKIPGKGKFTSTVLPKLECLIMMSEASSPDFLDMSDVYEIGTSTEGLPCVDPEDPAAIFMTSGTTGTPKMFSHTHYSLLLTGYYMADVYGDAVGPYYNDRPFQWHAG